MARRNKIPGNEADKVLVSAVMLGDVAAVQKAIRTGANVNAVQYRRCSTPLHEACKYGAKDEIVRILLNAGADPRWKLGSNGTSPALQACYNGHLSIVEILINHDNSLLEFSDGDDGMTPLAAAITFENVNLVRLLIHRGAKVFATVASRGGELTPLVRACLNDNVEIVRLLLTAGAKMEPTALHHAVLYGNIEVMRELILQQGADMFAVNSDGETPFDISCRGNFRSSISAPIDPLLQMYGIKMTQQYGRLALHAIVRAAGYNFFRFNNFHPPQNPLRILLPLGELTLNHFRTLLHYLNHNLVRNRDDSGKLPIHIACRTNAPVEVLALLSELDPATLHISDHGGALPLHDCCRGIVDYASVRYLVEQGGVGTLAARNREGALPLHVLCGSTNPSLRTVEYLMQSFPALVATPTFLGQYPFMSAACKTASASLSTVYELVRANPHLLASRIEISSRLFLIV